MQKRTEETIYPQGIAGYAIIGIYTGDDNSPPWVGPVKPTREEAARAYYDRACEYQGYDPAAFPPVDAWQDAMIDAHCTLGSGAEDTVEVGAADELLFMVKVPL